MGPRSIGSRLHLRCTITNPAKPSASLRVTRQSLGEPPQLPVRATIGIGFEHSPKAAGQCRGADSPSAAQELQRRFRGRSHDERSFFIVHGYWPENACDMLPLRVEFTVRGIKTIVSTQRRLPPPRKCAATTGAGTSNSR